MGYHHAVAFVGKYQGEQMFDTWQFDQIYEAIISIMTGDGDLHSRVKEAYKSLGEPFFNEKLPVQLQPVWLKLDEEIKGLARKEHHEITSEDLRREKELAHSLLKAFEYLAQRMNRIKAEQILDPSI